MQRLKIKLTIFKKAGDGIQMYLCFIIKVADCHMYHYLAMVKTDYE
jgi:hypothetical protein